MNDSIEHTPCTVLSVDVYDGAVKIGEAPVVDGKWEFKHTYLRGRHALTANVRAVESDGWHFDMPSEFRENFLNVSKPYVVINPNASYRDPDVPYCLFRNRTSSTSQMYLRSPEAFGAFYRGVVHDHTGWAAAEIEFDFGLAHVQIDIGRSGSTFGFALVECYNADKTKKLLSREIRPPVNGTQSVNFAAPPGEHIHYLYLGNMDGAGPRTFNISALVMTPA